MKHNQELFHFEGEKEKRWGNEKEYFFKQNNNNQIFAF